MKKGLFKIGIISTVLLLGICSVSSVKADETEKKCVTHRDYYFFSDLSRISDLTKNTTDSETWDRETRTYMPNINHVAGADLKVKDRVCLKKGSDGQSDCSSNMSWTIEEFWNHFAEINSKGKSGNYAGEKNIDYKYYTETDSDNIVNTYIMHSSWEEKIGDDNYESHEGSYKNISTSDYIKNSILLGIASGSKGNTKIAVDPSVKEATNYFTFNITRVVDKKDYAGINGFEYAWEDKTEATAVIPAGWYIEYDLCSEEPATPKYEANIEYVCRDENGKEMECPNGNPDPHHEGDLEDGYTRDVESPDIEGCTTDEEKVMIKIDGENFNHEVIYTCKVEKENKEPDDNPKTGDFLIVIAWIVGLGALGYSGYYFYKLKKSKAE